MYKFTWKHVACEIGLTLVCMYMVCAGVYFAWYALDLRNGAMALYLMTIVLPSSFAPFAIFMHYRNRLFQ